MWSVNKGAVEDPPSRVSNKNTNLAVFTAQHKNSLGLEIPLIWSFLLKNHQIPVAVDSRQVSSRVSSRYPAAPSLADHTVCRLDVCLNPMLECEQLFSHSSTYLPCTVKLGDKERFDKEQIGVKEPFPVTNLPIYFIKIRNIWR